MRSVRVSSGSARKSLKIAELASAQHRRHDLQRAPDVEQRLGSDLVVGIAALPAATRTTRPDAIT
jgi:hypothetical protein